MASDRCGDRRSHQTAERAAALKALAAAFVLSLLSASAAVAADPIKPDTRLTPGVVATTDANLVCRAGYAKSARHTSAKLKAFVYREYGIDRRSGHYEIDHLIPLSLGGADAAANLWPESWDTHPWNATRKDELEVYLHAAVCSGRMPLEQAQREIAEDWIAAYRQHIGER
jgi:hypothetical protein